MKDQLNEQQEYDNVDLSFVEEIEGFQQEFHNHSKEFIGEWLKFFF